MSIEVDWQVVDEGSQPPAQREAPPPPAKPRLRLPRPLWLKLVLPPILIAAALAACLAWTYRARLNQVAEPVRLVARLEAQTVAADDRASFMALQDPDDAAWRALQEKRFGRLERVGLPEFGWQAMDIRSELGDVALEPGGARLDVTYRFSVTQPLPGGPVSITLQLPEFYRPTPSGWVHAMPGPDFWGLWQQRAGKRVVVNYLQRDADVIEPLLPRLDELVKHVCDSLPCPPQVGLVFENSAESLARVSDFSYGFDDGAMIKLPSPHLIGLPTDAPSRDELYRAVGVRLVQALVYEASGRRLDINYVSAREIVRWELARAGLAGPIITAAITHTLALALQTGDWQPLSTLTLGSLPVKMDVAPGEVMLPLAFAFLEWHIGPSSVSRMIPAMETSATLGEAISATLRMNSITLEPAWQSYLRGQAGLLPTELPAPAGELTMWCAPNATDQVGSSIWRIRADGTGLARITAEGQNAGLPHWSPNGKQLAYTQGDSLSARVLVMDVDSQQVTLMADELKGVHLVGWLPDGRLEVAEQNWVHLMNVVSGQDHQFSDREQFWSPDGKWIVYNTARSPQPSIWIADSNGRGAHKVAPGYEPVWSPDSKRLAFLGPSGPSRVLSAREVRIADINGGVTTLAQGQALLQSLTGWKGEIGWINDLAWSPNGSLLAVTMAWRSGSGLWVIDVDAGLVRAQWQWSWTKAEASDRAWSSDGRHLAIGVKSNSLSQGEVSILDAQTGRHVELAGKGFDWSPDGKWLTITQEPTGILLVASDLSAMRGLETPSCIDVAWRPGR